MESPYVSAQRLRFVSLFLAHHTHPVCMSLLSRMKGLDARPPVNEHKMIFTSYFYHHPQSACSCLYAEIKLMLVRVVRE